LLDAKRLELLVRLYVRFVDLMERKMISGMSFHICSKHPSPASRRESQLGDDEF
jgi:hypothetical protein